MRRTGVGPGGRGDYGYVSLLDRALRTNVGSQAVRFLMVGAVATVVDVALFNLLHVLAGVDPLLAKSLSTTTSAVVAFVGNRQWSFPRRQGLGLRRQVSRYVAVNVAGLAIALAPIAVTRSLLGLDGIVAMNVAANVIGLGLATCFRFYGYRHWVFGPPHRGGHAPVAGAGRARFGPCRLADNPQPPGT
jgi:putative flippase GtrA